MKRLANNRCCGRSILNKVRTKLSLLSAKCAAVSTPTIAAIIFTADSMSLALMATLFVLCARRRLRVRLQTGRFGSINEGVRVGVVSYIHIHVGRDKDAKDV